MRVCDGSLFTNQKKKTPGSRIDDCYYYGQLYTEAYIPRYILADEKRSRGERSVPSPSGHPIHDCRDGNRQKNDQQLDEKMEYYTISLIFLMSRTDTPIISITVVRWRFSQSPAIVCRYLYHCVQSVSSKRCL